jgi:predicted DNA-binding transcriptional regulator AlpA
MADVLEKSYRLRTVLELFDLKRSTLYHEMDRGLFPRPDYYLGKMPMWNDSTLVRHRQTLIKANGKRRVAK